MIFLKNFIINGSDEANEKYRKKVSWIIFSILFLSLFISQSYKYFGGDIFGSIIIIASSFIASYIISKGVINRSSKFISGIDIAVRVIGGYILFFIISSILSYILYISISTSIYL